MGTQFGDKWSERHFSWSGDASAAPVNGTVLTATSNVNLRAGHIRFSLDTGWQNSDVLTIVSRGQRVTVREVKEVAPGFYWAEVELGS